MNVIFTIKKNERVMLRADDHNYELCRPRFRKDKASGEMVEEWTGFKWYAGLDHALMRIVDMKVRASDAQSLKELAADLAAAREEIRAAWSMEVGKVDSPAATTT